MSGLGRIASLRGVFILGVRILGRSTNLWVSSHGEEIQHTAPSVFPSLPDELVEPVSNTIGSGEWLLNPFHDFVSSSGQLPRTYDIWFGVRHEPRLSNIVSRVMRPQVCL